jgi:hypothetical protein
MGMLTPELTENVKQKLESGLSPENIETILTKNGWKKEDVDEALRGLNHPAAAPAAANIAPPASAQNPAPNGAGPQTSASNVLTAAAPAGSGKKKYLIPVLCIVAVLVLAGGYFAYGYYESLPMVALPKAALKLANLSTLHYDGQVSLTLKNSAPSSTSALPIPAEGTAYVFTFDTETDLVNRVTDTAASVDVQSKSGISSSTVLASLEFRAIQSIVYIQLLTLPDLGSFNIDKLKNQWIKIDPAAITAQMKQMGVAVGSSTTSDISNFDSLGSDQIKNAIDIAKKYELFDPARYLGTEDIDGKPAFHYTRALNLKNAASYLEAVQAATPGKLPPGTADNLKESIQEDPQIDIWIAKGTGFPAKAAVSFDFGNAPLIRTGGVHANAVIHFQNFNEPVDIAAPVNSIDIVDIFKSFSNATSVNPFAGSQTGASQVDILENSRDARRISDLRFMQLALELYFNKNVCYPMAGSSSASPCAGTPGAMSWPALSALLHNSGIGLNIIPDDPNVASGAHYFYASNGQVAEVGAILENQANPALNSSGDKGVLLSQCKTANAYCLVQP